MTAEHVSGALDLLASLESIGVELWLEDSTIRYRAPKGLMTPERLESLRARRGEITDILHSSGRPVTVAHDAAARYEPFPLTGVQAAYLTGRSGNLRYGQVGCHGYGELRFAEVDPERLDAAWNTLVRRHDMLRAVIWADGTQQVQEDPPPFRIAVDDLGPVAVGPFQDAVAAVRASMDHRVYQAGQWPLFDLRLTRAHGSAILHFSIDFLIADFVSLQVLLEELEQEYADTGSSGPAPEVTFRDLQIGLVSARSGLAARKDRAYWWQRIDELPEPPELPLAPGEQDQPRFYRLAGRLSPADWDRFRQQAQGIGLTPACAVLAAYAEVVGRWSRHPEFTLNVTVLNRPAIHPQVGRVVGDFTSVELLAVSTRHGKPFLSRAQAVQERLWEDLDHGLCSGLDVMRELRKRRAGGLTLFPVVFTSSIGIRGDRPRADGGFERLVHGISQTPQVWLDCQVTEAGGGLAFNWDLRQGVFPGGVPEAMFGAFERLLGFLAAGREGWQSACPVPLPPDQLARRPRPDVRTGARTADRNRGQNGGPHGVLHGGVLEQAARHPDRTAVVSGSLTLSFGELAGRACAVAEALRERGCQPDAMVAVEMDKGWEQVAAVLGILMNGGAYVPVDMVQPASRRDRILRDAGAEVVLVQARNRAATRHPGLTSVAVDELGTSDRMVTVPRQGGDLAYVIYTSGSSGAPKGVMISHQAARNTIDDISERFGIGPGDRILGLANLGFDLSVYDIFGTLAAGGCLVLPDQARRSDPAHWAELIESRQVTVWNSVPAQLEMLTAFLRSGPAAGLSSLRLGLLSGDWISPALPGVVRDLLPGLRLISLGGATEAAIWSIFHPIDGSEDQLPSIPYGRPLANQAVGVLSDDLLELPDLVTGEIYISGAGLADGYLADPDKTAERFIPHPATGTRMYRTGDLGRYRPDGEIEFLGRQDAQVKIRGHRVELAEIESALVAHPAVAAAAIVPVGQRPDPITLIAFAEPATTAPAESVSAQELRYIALAEAADLRAQVDDGQMLAFAAELDTTALTQMLATLRGCGLFAAEQDQHPLAEILERARVAPRHHRLVRRWLRALLGHGLLHQDPASGSYTAAAFADADAVRAGWRRVSQLIPDVEQRTELLSYFRTTADNLPALLSGDLDPLKLLFPEGRTHIHEVAYNAMFLSRYLNRLLTSAACHLASLHKGPEPFRVLEVGAGVGGTSVELIPALAAYDVEYLFTDVSEFFLNNARQRFAGHGWVGYARYDMNQDFRAQGLEPNSYELIVCANVLHYARSADDVLGELKHLLKPGGWILFIEATRDSYQIMTSMEFLFDEASGEFSDVRRLKEQTFLSTGQWLDILAGAGPDSMAGLPERDPITEQMGMQVFAARFKADRAALTRQDLGRHLTELLPEHMLPARLQVVDALPLTGNGKIDRKILRAWAGPGSWGRQAAGTPEPPAGDVERQVAGIWERLLRVEGIGRTQSYFELGGDSLLAAQIAAEIRQGVPDAEAGFYEDLLRLILENATVATLVAYIGRDRKQPSGTRTAPPSGSPLVHLAEGPGMTAFVHDGTGTLAAYRPLIDALTGRTALVGLTVRDPGSYLELSAGSLIEEAAYDYAQALTARGRDHLRLVGHGWGGILAAEVASQMVELGMPIGDLVVIASAPPAWPAADDLLAELLFWRELGIGAARLAPRPAASPSELMDLLRAEPPRERFARLADAVPETSLEQARAMFGHSMAAAAAHRALPYAGDMTLVRPRSGPLWPGLREEMESYWREACLGDLRIVDLDCDAIGAADPAPVLVGLLTPSGEDA